VLGTRDDASRSRPAGEIAVAFDDGFADDAAGRCREARFEEVTLRSVRNRALQILILSTVMALALGACATPPTDPAARAEFDRTNDPFEPVNRRILAFNLFVDRILIKPLATTYEAAIPEDGRTAVRNVLDNLHEPVVFANNLLQGEFKRAHDTAGRFTMNSTMGLGGMLDLATRAGLEKQTGDFGQTLFSWGVPDGPYLVLPVLGPSNPRDAVGYGVDSYADPYSHIFSGNTISDADYGRFAVNGLDERARNIQTLDELQRNAIDFYAELRSLYRQHRATELRHGEPPPLPELDLDDDSTPKK
jgi:phospholipid-binding lipoprotein MlaA